MPTVVYLVRHGVTDWNVAHRLAGRLPGISLNSDGRGEAAAVASRLAALPIGRVASSPLERAQETAERIARPHGLAVATETALLERGYPAWQGLSAAEIRERFRDDVDAVARGGRVRGVESVEEMAERMWAVVERLAALHADEAIVIVSHADPIRAVIARIVGVPPARLRAITIDTGSLSRIRRRDAAAVVDYTNSRIHLDALGTPGQSSSSPA
ncbi:MAG TPA: histidine phosphatase family protein [bacterium]|nr:histidine phosphatase family protein [bacterium]